MIGYGFKVLSVSGALDCLEDLLPHRCWDVEFFGGVGEEEEFPDRVELGSLSVVDFGRCLLEDTLLTVGFGLTKGL